MKKLIVLAAVLLAGCAYLPTPDCPFDRNILTDKDAEFDCRVHWTIPLGDQGGDSSAISAEASPQESAPEPAAEPDSEPASEPSEPGQSGGKGHGGHGHGKGCGK